MKRRLVVLCLVLSACGAGETPAPDAPSAPEMPNRLAEGVWTGGLTPMNHPDMVTPITYEVSYDGDALALVLGGPGDVVMPARDVAFVGDTLRFTFEEPADAVTLRCALGRAAAGGFEGRCDDGEGKWARFVMTPPAD